MKNKFFIGLCLIFASFTAGCMDLLLEKRDTVSKISNFSITPTVVGQDSFFYININAEVGHNAYISAQRYGTSGGNMQRIYDINKDKFENGTIPVKYERNGVNGYFLTSEKEGWLSSFSVQPLSYFEFYLTVCDVAIVPGNSHCEYQGPIVVTFR